MGSIGDPAGGARRPRLSARRWLAGGLTVASVVLGLVAFGPPALASRPKWLTVSAGHDHTCAIKTDTTLWCWGANDKGQLGVEGVGGSDLPLEVGGTGWSVVSAGTRFTCGIRNGRRYCWGENTYGQLGLRDTRDRSTPVVGPGESNNWLTISAGVTHACGLRTSGLAQCWGDNWTGQLGIDSSVALRDRPTTVAGGITWSAIGVGSRFTCGLDVNGRRYCWGGNTGGQLGLGLDWREKRFAPDYLPGDYTYSSIDLGTIVACGITTSLWLACWGWGSGYQLGLGDTETRYVPTLVPGTNWLSVSVGHQHVCGLRLRLVLPSPKVDQRYCWGMNGWGQLGDDSWDYRTTPTWIDGPWRLVSAGDDHTCGISSSQELWCWGSNVDGQLGVGKAFVRELSLEPVVIRDA